MIEWPEAERVAGVVGPAYFLFDEDRFRSNLRGFRAAFLDVHPKVEVGYSYKTNYTPYVCRVAHDEGYLAEVVSEMEYQLAVRLGVPPARIIFNGPAKSEGALAVAARAGATVNVDGLSELDQLLGAPADAAAPPARVALRCSFDVPGCAVSRFGMSVESGELPLAVELAQSSPAIDLVGLHCHFPTRDIASFRHRARTMVELADRFFTDRPPETLNLGGGYMGSMSPELARRLGVTPASYAEYAAAVAEPLRERFGAGNEAPTLVLEPGTAVVADTFTFVARVMGVKSLGGRSVATLAGSSLDVSATSLRSKLPVTFIERQPGRAPEEPWTIGGFTCIEGDLLADGVLGALQVGDYVGIENVGSYSVSMRPPFISPSAAVVVPGEDDRVIKRRQDLDDVFAGYVLDAWT